MKSLHKKKPKRLPVENATHKKICAYIRKRYPWAWFTHELAEGLPASIRKRIKGLRSYRGVADIIIFMPRGDFHGMFLEVKKETEKVFKKDGSLRKDVHLQEQHDFLSLMRCLGFYAEFCVGDKDGKNQIDKYFSLSPNYNEKEYMDLWSKVNKRRK